MKLPPITPLRLPRDTCGVIVFGGSFDPPHLWHTHIASAARRKVFGTKGVIVFVPAARSPHKQHGPIACDEDRVAMLTLATRRMKRCVIWTDEIDRARVGGSEPSYTIDTLRRLHRAIRDSGIASTKAPMRLLIGADQALAFHRWREPEQVAKTAEPLVVLRPPVDHSAKLVESLRKSNAWSESQLVEWQQRVLAVATRDISSTNVRAKSARGQSMETTGRWTSVAVGRFIRRRKLYAHKPPGA